MRCAPWERGRRLAAERLEVTNQGALEGYGDRPGVKEDHAVTDEPSSHVYCAHVVLGVELLGVEQQQFPLWENLLLVSASSPQGAVALGRDAGQAVAEAAEGSGFKWGGAPARWRLMGVRRVCGCRVWQQGDAIGLVGSALDFRLQSSEAFDGFMTDEEVEVLAPFVLGLEISGPSSSAGPLVTEEHLARMVSVPAEVGHLTLVRRTREDPWPVEVKEVVAVLPSIEGSIKQTASRLAADLLVTLSSQQGGAEVGGWEYAGLRKVLRLPDDMGESGAELTWLQLFGRDPRSRIEYAQGRPATLVFDDQTFEPQD